MIIMRIERGEARRRCTAARTPEAPPPMMATTSDRRDIVVWYSY
jgi:hypothetical protein